MFLFLWYSVAAVTNKFPHLQDIKGFLILILIVDLDYYQIQYLAFVWSSESLFFGFFLNFFSALALMQHLSCYC